MNEEIKVVKLSENDTDRWNKLLFTANTSSHRLNLIDQYYKRIDGRENETFIFNKNGNDIAGAHYSTTRNFKRLFKVAEINSGILFKESPDSYLIAFIINDFQNWAKENRCMYMSITPWLPKEIDGRITDNVDMFQNVAERANLTALKKGRHTYWIDLNKSEEELMAGIRKKRRRILKRALKSNFEFRCIEKPDEEIIHKFGDLHHSLRMRKGLKQKNRDHFESYIKKTLSEGLAFLFITRCNDEIVNLALTSKIGDAIGIYSSINTKDINNQECYSPGTMSKWDTILALKHKGYRIHNMGYSPGKTPIKGHPKYDIWHFKYGFGGMHVEYLPTYGKTIEPIRGNMYKYLKYKIKNDDA